MSIVRRLIAVIVILISTLVLVAAITGAFGVWVVRARVVTRVTQTFDRVDNILGLAERALRDADTGLVNATRSVEEARDNQAKLGNNRDRNQLLLRLIAMRIDDGVTPQIQTTRDRLLMVTEAAVAINSLLSDVSDLPKADVSRADDERVKQARSLLERLAGTAQDLNGMLSDPQAADNATSSAVGSRIIDIQEVLKKVRALVLEYLARVTEIKGEVDTVRTRTLAWINLGTVALSVLFSWIALSQLSMLAHGWNWLKKRPNSPPAETPG